MRAGLRIPVRGVGHRVTFGLVATTLLVAGLAWAAAGSAQDDVARPHSWDFEKAQAGAPPPGFSQEVGRWEVVAEGSNHVLAQTAESERRTYNVTLVEPTSYQNLDLTVKVKANTGEVDQGGGIIWRARDKYNYYVARYNPLEDNVRVYKVEAGRRTQLDHADARGDREWHTLRITMNGREILGYLDGQRLLVAEDTTFREAGKIGLWTKADARTSFDDLGVREVPAKATP